MSNILLSGSSVTLQSQSSEYSQVFSAAVSTSGSTNYCQWNCTQGKVSCVQFGSPDVSSCLNFSSAGATLPAGASPYLLTIYGLTYNSQSQTYGVMPVNSPITIGSYVGFAAVNPTGVLQTGPADQASGTNNVVQIQGSSWSTGDGDASYRVWVIVTPAPTDTSSGEAAAYGHFSSSTPNSGNNAGNTFVYYGTAYYVQSVGKITDDGGETQYWIAGSQGGYPCCGGNLYTYHIENGDFPTSNTEDFSFVFYTPQGGLPGQCVPACVAGATCDPNSGVCYTPGVCSPPCNTAAGWVCGASDVCTPGGVPICGAGCGAGYTCVYGATGVTGGAGSTCQLVLPCGGCPSGQTCDAGSCQPLSQHHDWWIWVAVAAVVLVFLFVVVIVVVLVFAKKKKAPAGAPEQE